MIVIHEMAAPYDLAGMNIRQGDSMYHVLSDRPRPDGTAELLTFMRQCGAQDTWMQATGTYREHYDAFGELAERVRYRSAMSASNAEVAAILTRKRLADRDTEIAIPNVTARQMNELLHKLTVAGTVMPTQMLATAAARVVRCAGQLVPQSLATSAIVVYVGTGQTGRVALAAATLLHQQSARVTLVTAGNTLPLPQTLAAADLIIDGLLGSGITRSPRGFCRDAINQIFQSPLPTLAIDLPSGLSGNEGVRYLPTVAATATLALGLPKRGVLLTDAAAYIGKLWLADVGLTARQLKHMSVRMDATVFATAPIVPLMRRPLATDVAGFSSPYCRWVVER